jgi:hypothetical protein
VASLSEPVRLVLEIDVRADPIVGALRLEGSDEVSFTGWVALIAALEAALRPGAPLDAPAP